MTSCLCCELMVTDLPGKRVATFIVEPLDDPNEVEKGVTLEVHAYNSQATEPGVGCILDIGLGVTGEDRPKTKKRPHGGYHRIEVGASLNKEQARALRDHINMFLGFE